MFLVLLILSPDYLVIFAYLTLVWQLHSFYNDGYASFLTQFSLICKRNSWKFNIFFITFLIFSLQLVFTILYIFNIMEAEKLVELLTSINFFIPGLTIILVCYLKCKFSGIPKKDEYKSRLKKLNWAVSIWSVTRIIRAITSLWDTYLFFGMMLELQPMEKIIQWWMISSEPNLLQ